MNVSVQDILVSIFIIFGGTLMLIGAFGLWRLPDVFMRLHGPSKATTLGIGAILVSSILHFSFLGTISFHEVLITVFLFITAPVSSHLIAKVAIRMRVPTVTRGEIPDEVGTTVDGANTPTTRG
jgi:multicomponent K+:H+ antiporter subunit G